MSRIYDYYKKYFHLVDRASLKTLLKGYILHNEIKYMI